MWKLAGVLWATLLVATAVPAQTLDYPTKPLRLIVGYVAGGSTDILARLTASKLSEFIGQQIVVDNKPGANGSIAAESVARACPDGYTLFIGGAASAINASLYKRLSGPTRRASMPDVPTPKEQGFDVVILSWAGIYVPAGTPPAIVEYLNAQMRKVPAMPDYRERLSSLGVEPQVMSVDEMKSYTRAEIAKFARVVEASGVRAD